MLTLSDGSLVEAVFSGDEFNHYWLSSDGRHLVEQSDGLFAERSAEATARAFGRSQSANRMRRSRSRKAAFTGEKKGLVILMSFKDKSFSTSYDEWNAMLNERGYSSNGAPGSVADYFYDQSSGVFQLSFDVYGPFTANYNMSYYGQNDSYGDDKNVDKLVVEACDAIRDSVDFSQYDWDGDGYVDQVFILYAGYGENTTGVSSNAIWPHEYWLQYYNDYWGKGYQVQTGVWVNTYACSCELYGKSGQRLDGIGTFCHEFSHCLGLPDFYSSSSSYSTPTAWDWDLLDYGAYNGNNWCPPNYNAYERIFCGWLETEELPASGSVMLEPIDQNVAYRISNSGWSDEYYLLENRQKTKWDAESPGEGLLVFHVDYKQSAWDNNDPNGSSTHPRMAPISAIGKYGLNYTYGYTFPYQKKDSLTDSSSPALTWYNSDKRGMKTAGVSLTNISKQSDGTVTFDHDNGAYTAVGSLAERDGTTDSPLFDLGGRRRNASDGGRGILIRQGQKIITNKH